MAAMMGLGLSCHILWLLHQQVARQTEARTQLQRLAKDRQVFLDGWVEYLQTLTGTVEQQVTKMAQVLANFDSAETQWQSQLSDATELLSRAGGRTSSAPRSLEAMEEEETAVALRHSEKAPELRAGGPKTRTWSTWRSRPLGSPTSTHHMWFRCGECRPSTSDDVARLCCV